MARPTLKEQLAEIGDATVREACASLRAGLWFATIPAVAFALQFVADWLGEFGHPPAPSLVRLAGVFLGICWLGFVYDDLLKRVTARKEREAWQAAKREARERRAA